MRRLIILSAFLFAQIIYSQQDPSTQNLNGVSNTASPNVASFMRFQESPVNYYNGRSSFSIPIYEINVGGIKYPISLNYSQGGIQVNSMASDVGLGWSLTSTFINRTIVGDADLETIVDTNWFVNKNKYGYFDYKINEFILNHYGGNLNVDFYPDLFKFVSPTNSNKFYFINKTQVEELDKKGTKINWSIETISDNKYLKNSSDNWVNTSLSISDYKDFNLTTKDGLSYSFQNKDISHSFIKSSENENEFGFGGITGSYPRVSSWYVSKIKNNNSNEELNFSYETYSSEEYYKINDIIDKHPYYRYESKFPSAHVDEDPQNNIYFKPIIYGNLYDGDYGRYYNRLLQSQRIKSIKFRGGIVEFKYNTVDREDLKYGRALTTIIIKDDNGKTIKEFELKYDYFYSELSKNEFSKRLKLLSVQELGQNKFEFQYYEDSKLPNIGSPLQDFFGYNNSIETTVEIPSYIFPKYYYYPNKGEYSILPYNITSDTNHYILTQEQFLNQQIDREPNELSKIWSLKSVKFPTGGTNSYLLESNTFNLWGNTLKGGGTRIQQQIIEEHTGGKQRVINYNYNNGNISSGYLFNVPDAGYPASLLFSKSSLTPDLSNFGLSLTDYFFLYSKAKVNFDILNNFFVGYSKIEENENGTKTIYEYINQEKPNILTRSFSQNFPLTIFFLHPMGEFLISNSSYGNNLYVDNSYKRGKLKYITYYEKNKTNPVMLKENFYKYLDFTDAQNDHGNVIPGTSIYSDPIPLISDHEPYEVYHEPYELMQFTKSYNIIYNNLVDTKTTKYFPSGDVEEVSHMNYDGYQNLSEVSNKISDGLTFPIINLNKYYYPYNFSDPLSQAFEERNKSDTPILIKSYSGEIDPSTITNPGSQYLTSQSKVEFSVDANTSNLLLPTQAMTAIGQNSFYEVGKFDRYDSRGNLLQSTKDGLSTTYLYGYNQLYPIAKIEGATYEQVMTALGVSSPTENSSYLGLDIVTKSNADIDEATENDLINFLDAFRKHANLANFRVTTYTHNPLVGVTSVTPPSGMREVYIYEAVTNKLKEVKRMEKDAGGNDVYRTLKEYEYHYKPQN